MRSTKGSSGKPAWKARSASIERSPRSSAMSMGHAALVLHTPRFPSKLVFAAVTPPEMTTLAVPVPLAAIASFVIVPPTAGAIIVVAAIGVLPSAADILVPMLPAVVAALPTTVVTRAHVFSHHSPSAVVIRDGERDHEVAPPLVDVGCLVRTGRGEDASRARKRIGSRAVVEVHVRGVRPVTEVPTEGEVVAPRVDRGGP